MGESTVLRLPDRAWGEIFSDSLSGSTLGPDGRLFASKLSQILVAGRSAPSMALFMFSAAA